MPPPTHEKVQDAAGGEGRAASDSTLSRAAATAWRITIIGVAIILAGYLAKKLQAILIPMLIAVLLAAFIRPVVQRLDRRLPRWLAVLLPMLVLSALIAGALALVVFSIKAETDGLEASVSTGAEKLRGIYDQAKGWFGTNTVNALDDPLSGAIDLIPSIVGKLAIGLAAALLEIMLGVVLCYFLLLDLGTLASAVESRVRPTTYARMAAVVEESWSRVELYLRGIAITALANALMFGAALWIIGVPLVGTNMVILFIGSFIPYVGPVTATTVAALLALGDGGWTDVIFVIIAGVVVQLIEGNILHPFVVGRTVRVSPFVIILSVSTGAAVAGLVGALVAVPVVLVGILVFDALHEVAPPASGADAPQS